jgi:TM2 domain-containing membrane protein YozV
VLKEWSELMSQQGSAGNVLAAVASLFFPGLGQLLQGRILAALLFFCITAVCYFFFVLVIPAIIGGLFHLWSIIDAAKFKSGS